MTKVRHVGIMTEEHQVTDLTIWSSNHEPTYAKKNGTNSETELQLLRIFFCDKVCKSNFNPV